MSEERAPRAGAGLAHGTDRMTNGCGSGRLAAETVKEMGADKDVKCV